MNRALPWIAIGAGLGIACSDPTTTQITQLNLDRPIDVAFAWYGSMRQTNGRHTGMTTDPVIQTAMPLAACQALSPPLTVYDPNEKLKPVPPPPAPGQETLSDGSALRPAWYAFILQSASGTVALATWAVGTGDKMSPIGDAAHDMLVLDADPLTPGKNAISIGEDPIAITTDHSGCFEVTANAGSCDLSELEINSALDNTLFGGNAQATPVRVDRVPVKNAMGTALLARPAAMVATPGDPVVGNACPATPTGRVYIAYPGCHLVAGIDTATGTIVSAIQFNSAGVPSILSGAALTGVTCPDECTNASGGLGNGAVTPGVRPVALDLRFDPRTDTSKPAVTNRLAIGADISGAPAGTIPLTLVELDPNPVASTPLSLSQIPLQPATVGARSTAVSVTALALSPQIGMGGDAGQSGSEVSDEATPGGQGQYIYAVATDGTVRVADVLNLRRECDTQIDGRFLRNARVTDLQCLPMGDATRPRRSGARGPGIELPEDGVPNSVAIVKARTSPPPIKDTLGNVTGSERAAPATWVGYFAMISSANGAVYVANVDDDLAPDEFSGGNPFGTQPVLVMAHQLRDNFTQRSALSTDATPRPVCNVVDPPVGVLGGPPRISQAPAQLIPTSTLDASRVTELPQILHVDCEDLPANADPMTPPTKHSVSELEFAAPPATRDVVYPDLGSVASETWSLTWEGLLSVDNGTRFIDGPPVREGQLHVDPFGMHLTDPNQPFCEIGVEPFDTAELRGCDPANRDSDCPAGYTCYVHPKYINPTNGPSIGACMLKNEAPRLADACRDFLTTRRRYTVGRVDAGEVVLLERKHALENTPVDGCDSDDQCDALARLARAVDQSADPFLEEDPAQPAAARSKWSCQTDPLRAPISSDPARNKRCIQSCIVNPQQQPHFECANGAVCHPVRTPQPGEMDIPGVCLEGVEPPQACLNGPQRYDFRTSEAFTVIGGRSGYVHPMIRQGDTCVRDPSLNPSTVQIGRIPVRAPACDPSCTTDVCKVTGQLPGGGFEANPCSLTAMQFDNVVADPAHCELLPATQATLGLRPTPAIKFRNRAMVLTIVDPYRPCLLAPRPSVDPRDPQSRTPANLPFAVTGYQLEFVQKAGYVPNVFTLPLVGTASPVKVIRGPTESIWVIDDGDFLSTSITQASTRGRVYRVESIDVNITNILQ